MTLETGVVSPIPYIDDSSPRDEVVELGIVEHFDPLFVDDLFESFSDEPGLSIEGTVHFVVYQQIYILHFVRTV